MPTGSQAQAHLGTHSGGIDFHVDQHRGHCHIKGGIQVNRQHTQAGWQG